MRIVLILTVFLLSACSTAQPVAQGPYATPDVKVAERVCRKKGYDPGSFEYAECYGNRPEVQATVRNARFSNLHIINENRSDRVTSGRSYPVE